MNLPLLVVDPLSEFLGPVVMDFVVPGLFFGGIVMFVLYSWAKDNGWV